MFVLALLSTALTSVLSETECTLFDAVNNQPRFHICVPICPSGLRILGKTLTANGWAAASHCSHQYYSSSIENLFSCTEVTVSCSSSIRIYKISAFCKSKTICSVDYIEEKSSIPISTVVRNRGQSVEIYIIVPFKFVNNKRYLGVWCTGLKTGFYCTNLIQCGNNPVIAVQIPDTEIPTSGLQDIYYCTGKLYYGDVYKLTASLQILSNVSVGDQKILDTLATPLPANNVEVANADGWQRNGMHAYAITVTYNPESLMTHTAIYYSSTDPYAWDNYKLFETNFNISHRRQQFQYLLSPYPGAIYYIHIKVLSLSEQGSSTSEPLISNPLIQTPKEPYAVEATIERPKETVIIVNLIITMVTQTLLTHFVISVYPLNIQPILIVPEEKVATVMGKKKVSIQYTGITMARIRLSVTTASGICGGQCNNKSDFSAFKESEEVYSPLILIPAFVDDTKLQNARIGIWVLIIAVLFLELLALLMIGFLHQRETERIHKLTNLLEIPTRWSSISHSKIQRMKGSVQKNSQDKSGLYSLHDRRCSSSSVNSMRNQTRRRYSEPFRNMS